jgi:hypothetical protein
LRQLYFTLLINILITINIYADTFTSNGSGGGVWDVNTTWTVGGVTPALGVYPGSGDDVIIQVGDIVTASSSTTTRFRNISISGEFQVNGSNDTYVYGNTENNGTISGSGNYWQVRDGTYSGTGNITSKLKCSFKTLTMNSDISTTNDIDIVNSGELLISSGVTLTVNGVIKCNATGIVTNNGTIDVNTNSFFVLNSPSSTQLFSANGDIVWNTTSNFSGPNDSYKNVTLNQSTTCTSDFSIKGNFENNATFTSSSTGNTITFDGSSIQTISGTGICNFKKITLNNSNGLTLSCNEINIDEVMGQHQEPLTKTNQI